ncbi:LysR family transcriptional regulator [Acetobacteraceae bacterium KSS8]|uniref:LysR family transcriptional regulator n=1 Tax=Endosaccharibacter trunci TaxID=2812733 RepID=A0ABT1W8P2_9PROT|nr:LysR family transcriptional regulator [Acetobacteraceae bacterium KSS8]
MADTGSFSAASRKLRVPVTTVTRCVAELEVHLRTKLLQRTTREGTLTDTDALYVAAGGDSICSERLAAKISQFRMSLRRHFAAESDGHSCQSRAVSNGGDCMEVPAGWQA